MYFPPNADQPRAEAGISARDGPAAQFGGQAQFRGSPTQAFGDDEGFIGPRTSPCWFNEKPAGDDRTLKDLCTVT